MDRKMRDYISKQDFVRAASEYGLNFLILGDNRKELAGFISSRLMPDMIASNSPNQTQTQFLKSMVNAQKESLNTVGLWVEGNSTKSRAEIQALLEKRAQQFIRDLEKRQPGVRYYVTYNLDPRKVDIGGKQRDVVGEIFMMRALQYDQGRMVGYSVDPALSADPRYVISDEMFRILFASMGMRQKLRVMSYRNDNWTDKKSDLLVGSIIHELVDEMDAMSTNAKMANQRFQFLDEVETPQSSRALSNSTKQWAQILAGAYLYADVKKAKWRKEYMARVMALVPKLGGGEGKKNFEAQLKVYQDSMAVRKKLLFGNKPVVNARQMLTMPMLFRTTRSLEIIDKQRSSPFAIQWQKSEGF
jgi:hypothetical protein